MEWLEFKEKFHSKEEIGERISAISKVHAFAMCCIDILYSEYAKRTGIIFFVS